MLEKLRALPKNTFYAYLAGSNQCLKQHLVQRVYMTVVKMFLKSQDSLKKEGCMYSKIQWCQSLVLKKRHKTIYKTMPHSYWVKT